MGPAAAPSGRLHPISFRSLTVVRAGGALCRVRALTSSFARRPHPLPHFVQALSAAASTSRFGLQPPSAAVAPLPARLSVRLRRARRLGTWWRCVAAARSALRRLDLTLVSYAASFPLAPSLVLQAREYSASAILHAPDGVSAGGGNGVNNDGPAAAAPVGTKTRVLWVQRAGAKSWAALTFTGGTFVGILKKDIKTELPSLRDVDTDSIMLQLAVKDAGGTDKLVALFSMDTIDEALKKAAEAAGRTIKDTDKLRIIVDVDVPAAPLAASADGEDADAVQRRSMRARVLCRFVAAPHDPALSSIAYTACCCHPVRRHHLQHCVRKPSFSPTCGRP